MVLFLTKFRLFLQILLQDQDRLGLKVELCSLLNPQQIQFCMIFLCNGGIGEEEKGSISRYWKENEEDITASMDTLMVDIEERLEQQELARMQRNSEFLPSSSTEDEFLVTWKKGDVALEMLMMMILFLELRMLQ
jgi:hypothetical protein